MIVAGLDLSNTYCGVAVIVHAEGDKLPTLAKLAAVPGAGSEDADKTAARVLALLPGVLAHVPGETRTVDLVRYEKPPTSGSKGEHGRRLMEIGYALGWVNGLTIGPLRARGIPCESVMPAKWRTTMIDCANAWGVPASPPADKPPARVLSKGAEVHAAGAAGSYVLRFACGHEARITGGLAALTRRVERPCQECENPSRAPDTLDWKSDEWKRIACHLVSRLWPVPYGELVAKARVRARTNPPDHQLAGVHDACEAAWVAVHGLVEAASVRQARRARA